MDTQDAFPPSFGFELPGATPPSWYPPRRRGRRRSFAILVSIALLVALVGGGYLFSPGNGSPASRLASYTWCCSAKEVSARWVVPRVVGPMTTSSEAIWVGVQNGYGAHPQLFVQVGVLVVGTAGLQPEYFGFWSDADKDFQAQLLQVLVPGQIVRAQLTYRSGTWIARLWNGTNLETKVLGGLAAPSGDFAEWFEEDPLVTQSAPRYFAMPRAAPAHFEDLEVNGARPARSGLTAQSFTTKGGVTYLPTRLSGSDGFSVIR